MINLILMIDYDVRTDVISLIETGLCDGWEKGIRWEGYKVVRAMTDVLGAHFVRDALNGASAPIRDFDRARTCI